MNSNFYRLLKPLFSNMDTKLMEEGLDNDIVDELIKDFNKNTIDHQHDLLLKIQKILWNETNLSSREDQEELIFYGLLFYKLKLLTLVDLKVLINQLQINSMLTDFGLISVADLLTQVKNFNSVEKWMTELYDQLVELGNYIPRLGSILKFYQENYDQEIGDFTTAASLVDSIYDRSEYFQEIMDFASDDDLQEIIPWLNWKNKRRVTNYLIKKEIETIDDSNFEVELASKIEEVDSIINNFPQSFEVLGERISNLPAQVLTNETYDGIPNKFIASWAPKFVYSKPEVEQKIKIYFPGGKDIGHSGILVKTNEGLVLMDFGLSVVNNTLPRWHPMLEKLDALLLSHAHLDHSGGMPLLYHSDRKLPWFGRKETRVMCELLWSDTASLTQRYVAEDVIKKSEFKQLANFSNVSNALQNFNEISLNEEIKILPKVTVKAYNASHLYGSVGYELNIDGKRLLYTGDFNLDRMQASKQTLFPSDIDSIIFDGTYWGRPVDYPDSKQTLKQILNTSERIVIPAFGMGRSQEILFQLNELGADKSWKIYLTGMGGNLAKKLHLTIGPSGGGRSTGVNIVPTVDPDEFGTKTIVIAGQGMLQAGTSRNLLDATAEDPNTSVILCGYQAPNTLGYHLSSNHQYLKSKYQQQIHRVKMSGHSSSNSLSNFISTVTGKKIMVHSPSDARQNIGETDIILPDTPIDL